MQPKILWDCALLALQPGNLRLPSSPQNRIEAETTLTLFRFICRNKNNNTFLSSLSIATGQLSLGLHRESRRGRNHSFCSIMNCQDRLPQHLISDNTVESFGALVLEQQHNCQGRTTSPVSKRLRRSQKAVSFADEALVYPSNVSVDEASSMWYSHDELTVFKNDRKALVKLLKKHNFDVDLVGYHYCLRGLEPYFSLEVNRAIKYTRDFVLQTVFDEQSKQKDYGLDEPEALRTLCMEATKWAQDNALTVGLNDAIEAQEIREQFLLEQIEAELTVRAEKGHVLGRRGVKKTPSLTQQEANNLAWAHQQRHT